MRSVMQWSHRS